MFFLNIINITLFISFFCSHLQAQKVTDIFKNGQRIKKGEKIFLEFQPSSLSYYIAHDNQSPDPTHLSDSSIFLTSKNGINIFIKPLNPINYTIVGENKIVVDPINETATNALESMLQTLNSTVPKGAIAPAKPGKRGAKPRPTPCTKFTEIISDIEKIKEKLKDNKKDKIVKIFKVLKSLDFDTEDNTKKALKDIKKDIKRIEKHFEEIKEEIEILQESDDIKAYSCSSPEPFTAKYIFNDLLDKLVNIKNTQKKRLTNLKNIYKLVKNKQKQASSGGGKNLKWCTKVDLVPSHEGKISIYTLKILQSGYILSKDDEIVSLESKELITKTIQIRRFQRFIPDVSVGTAYTFFEYKTYGTTLNSLGKQVIADPSINYVKNINISSMINFNLYCPNSPIQPLYQIGLGINSEVPTLLTGIGIRINADGVRKIALSGGIALSWIKELNTLNVGDEVNGTSTIDEDLEYNFSWPPNGYIGIQFNF